MNELMAVALTCLQGSRERRHQQNRYTGSYTYSNVWLFKNAVFLCVPLPLYRP